MRLKRRTKIALTVVGFILLSGFLWLEPWAWMFGQPKIRISRETTYLIEPVRADGTIDYLAELNRRLSQGVTPDNNAAIPLLRAFGPHEIEMGLRPAFFAMLGIDPLPDQGDYFQPVSKYLEDRLKPRDDGMPTMTEEALDAMLEEAKARPWGDEEFPEMAAWLKFNEKPLESIVIASKKTMIFLPLIGTGDHPSVAGSPCYLLLSEAKGAANLLLTRAMLRAQQGHVDEAIEDVICARRLAKLLGARGSSMIQLLVSVAVDNLALEGVSSLAYYSSLTPAQIARLHDELEATRCNYDLAASVDQYERMLGLDAVATLTREGFDYLKPGLSPNHGWWGDFKNFININTTDWNQTLVVLNQWYDGVVPLLSEQNRGERRDKLRLYEKETEDKVRDEKDTAFIKTLFLGRRPRGRMVGDVLLTLLAPSVNMIDLVIDRNESQYRLAQTALALAAYRVGHNQYPKMLAELTPQYIAELPKDVFGGGDFHYERQENGFRLYSIGPNEIDDCGKGSDDGKDDIMIEFPRKPPKKADDPDTPSELNQPM